MIGNSFLTSKLYYFRVKGRKMTRIARRFSSGEKTQRGRAGDARSSQGRLSSQPRAPDRERLQAVMPGQQGQWTLAEMAQALSRGRATIATWIGVYRQEGLASLRRRRPVGRGANIADADREAWQEGLWQGKWKTAQEIQRWLKRERGLELTVWGVYYWLY